MNDKVKAACIEKIRNLFRETEKDAAKRKAARQEGRRHKGKASGEYVREEIGLWEVSHTLRQKNDKFVEDEIAGVAEFRPSMAWLATNSFTVVARRLYYNHPSYSVDRLFVRCQEISKEMEAKRKNEKQ